MSFIRTKKIKGIEYAYIVENSWKQSKVKQKSKKYLGKVYRFSKINETDFFEFLKMNDKENYFNIRTKQEILNDLVRWELTCRGFAEKDKMLTYPDVIIELAKNKILNSKGKNAALAMNEGYLTEYALKSLLKFKCVCEEDGYTLAKMFVEAGLAVPKEVFVGFYSKAI